jgi:hypothetical protein
MTNNKQQTAVEWYDNEIGKLFDQFLMGKIKLYEFQNKRFKLEQQAKEMEKERTINFTDDWYFYGPLLGVGIDVKSTIEQHFNNTYGGGEQ